MVYKYPWNSPYSFAINSPIKFIEINGEGPGEIVNNSSTAITLTGDGYINKKGFWPFATKTVMRGRIVLQPGDVYRVVNDRVNKDGTKNSEGIIIRKNGKTELTLINDVDHVDVQQGQRIEIYNTCVENKIIKDNPRKEDNFGENVPNNEIIGNKAPEKNEDGTVAFSPTPNKGEIKIDDSVGNIEFKDKIPGKKESEIVVLKTKGGRVEEAK